MNRLRWIILAVVTSLIAAGIAVAAHGDGKRDAFALEIMEAKKVETASDRALEGRGHHYRWTMYEGTVMNSSVAELDGHKARVFVRYGCNTARIKIRVMKGEDGNGPRYVAKFHGPAVWYKDNGTVSLDFWAKGRVWRNGHVRGGGYAKIADGTASFYIGSNGESGDMAILKQGRCLGPAAQDKKTDKPTTEEKKKDD